SFLGKLTGFEAYRNVPLTDAVGNNVVVRLSGETTLRVSQQLTGNDDSILRQNYLVFIPAPAPGTLRAFVSDARPAPSEVVNSIAPVITARIVNRDTSVNVGSIQLQFDGAPASPTVNSESYGASLSFTPVRQLGAFGSAPPAPGSHTNVLIFQ